MCLENCNTACNNTECSWDKGDCGINEESLYFFNTTTVGLYCNEINDSNLSMPGEWKIDGCMPEWVEDGWYAFFICLSVYQLF